MTQFDICSNTDEPRDFGMWGKKKPSVEGRKPCYLVYRWNLKELGIERSKEESDVATTEAGVRRSH